MFLRRCCSVQFCSRGGGTLTGEERLAVLGGTFEEPGRSVGDGLFLLFIVLSGSFRKNMNKVCLFAS